MNQREGVLYLTACEILGSHITAFYLMDVGLSSEPVYSRASLWIANAEKLGEWLSDEKFRFDKRIRPKHESTVIDVYLNEAYEIIDKQAKEAHKVYPEIDQNMWFYYYYCRWFLQALLEFEDLLKEEPLRSTEVFQAYAKNIDLFDELRDQLRSELSTLERINTSGEIIASLHRYSEDLTLTLKGRWRRALLEAADRESSE